MSQATTPQLKGGGKQKLATIKTVELTQRTDGQKKGLEVGPSLTPKGNKRRTGDGTQVVKAMFLEQTQYATL